MKVSNIVHLGSYRDRKGTRLRQTLALHGHDPERTKVLLQVWKAMSLVEADRGAVIWLDEYGPGLAHPYALLDLASDRPRRDFSPEPLRNSWDAGVPALLDIHATAKRPESLPQEVRSLCAVSLGSDGPRSWFLCLDSRTPRSALSQEVAGDLMFVAGECASLLLHPDLGMASDSRGASPGAGDESEDWNGPFAGWPVLQDIEGNERDGKGSERIATRFLVARVIRGLVEDDFVVDPSSLREQLVGVSRELARHSGHEAEVQIWERILTTLDRPEREGLLPLVLEWGGIVEGMGHFSGALEIHGLAYELAVEAGDINAAIDAARFRGRVHRKSAQWTEAIQWYGIAEGVAREARSHGKLAVILDGLANANRDRGNLPKARELLGQVLELGLQEDNRYAQAIAYHDLMTVEKEAGNPGEAIIHGWKAVNAYDSRDGRLFALFDLAGVFREMGDLSAAWDAYSIVAFQVGTFEYKILAFDAMALIAALKGSEERYDQLRARVDALGWDEEGSSAVVQGQVLLYRGLSARALGRRAEGDKWLSRALSFAEEHDLNKLIFVAEAALQEDTSTTTPEVGATEPQRGTPGSGVQEVRQGLREMREALAGVGEAL